jgi:hypothetical protein
VADLDQNTVFIAAHKIRQIPPNKHEFSKFDLHQLDQILKTPTYDWSKIARALSFPVDESRLSVMICKIV